MKVGILGNKNKVKSVQAIEEMELFVQSCGHETVRFNAYNEVDGVDVVLVLGGDGAILHSAVYAARKNIKVIGINYGTLGFLAEYEKNERERVKELLSALENGTCRIVKRSMLQLDVGEKTYFALNEIAIQRDYGLLSMNSKQILKLDIQAKEGRDEIAGDGVLICTPTGSTAYSLSAGGAILTPEVPVFMMTPICAFSMRARPIVFTDTDVFTVTIKSGKAIIQADGGMVAALPEGVEIRVKKAPFTADFPIQDNSDFFARVRNKLNN
ncbi:MAG: NAD(+)/NADH kinase [Clostridia bacterium]|nr:NAD(+)/NADH kinase [Clostridia bacterium]